MRPRLVRGILVVLGALAALTLALVGPVLARGEAWRSAVWSVWPGALPSPDAFFALDVKLKRPADWPLHGTLRLRVIDG